MHYPKEILINHIQQTTKYICDNDGNVICQSGWKNSDPEDPLNPCSEPICHGEQGCENGMCRAPDYCACEVGWEGIIFFVKSISRKFFSVKIISRFLNKNCM